MTRLMKLGRFSTLILFALGGSLCATDSVAAAEGAKDARAADPMTINFDGAEYAYRWAKNGQYKFLRHDDSDPEKWKDMVAINLLPKATTSEQLAGLANAVVVNYQRAGKILRNDSKPRTPSRPAEHLIVAVLGSTDFVEAAFARLMLVDGSGVVAVYSHRIYGKSASPEMGVWLKGNGPRVEAAMKLWDRVPASTALKKLPPRG